MHQNRRIIVLNVTAFFFFQNTTNKAIRACTLKYLKNASQTKSKLIFIQGIKIIHYDFPLKMDFDSLSCLILFDPI